MVTSESVPTQTGWQKIPHKIWGKVGRFQLLRIDYLKYTKVKPHGGHCPPLPPRKIVFASSRTFAQKPACLHNFLQIFCLFKFSLVTTISLQIQFALNSGKFREVSANSLQAPTLCDKFWYIYIYIYIIIYTLYIYINRFTLKNFKIR